MTLQKIDINMLNSRRTESSKNSGNLRLGTFPSLEGCPAGAGWFFDLEMVLRLISQNPCSAKLYYAG
jgi:hypothetical protein